MIKARVINQMFLRRGEVTKQIPGHAPPADDDAPLLVQVSLRADDRKSKAKLMELVRRIERKRAMPIMIFPCQAVQHSDQMVCEQCELVWDTNDPIPPNCKRTS